MVTQKGHRYKHNYAYNMLESVELPLTTTKNRQELSGRLPICVYSAVISFTMAARSISPKCPTFSGYLAL